MNRKPSAALNDISAAWSGAPEKPLLPRAAASSEVRKAFQDSAATAVDAAGSERRDGRDRYGDALAALVRRIDADPKRAAICAAVGSAVVTAALIGIFGRR